VLPTGGEHRGVGAALHRHRRVHPGQAHPGQQGGHAVARHCPPRPQSARRAGPAAGPRGCVPHSSTNTSRAGSTPLSCLRHRARAGSSRSVAVRPFASTAAPRAEAARPGSAAARDRATGRRSPATSTPAMPAGRRRRRTPRRVQPACIGCAGQPGRQPGLQLLPHLRLRPVPLLGRRQAAVRPAAGQIPLHGPSDTPNRVAACGWVIPASTAATTRARRFIEYARTLNGIRPSTAYRQSTSRPLSVVESSVRGGRPERAPRPCPLT
jgi:hypothetical protein